MSCQPAQHKTIKLSTLFLAISFFSSPLLLAQEQPIDFNVVTDSHRFQLSSFSESISINSIQEWRLHIETIDGKIVENAKIKVSGGMPQHNHGLPTAPQVTEYVGDGNYLVEGLKFHMPGQWQLKFDIEIENTTEQVTFDFKI